MKLFYKNQDGTKTEIAEITTNHSMTVYEAVDLINLEENSPAVFVDDEGIKCIDYDNIIMQY